MELQNYCFRNLQPLPIGHAINPKCKVPHMETLRTSSFRMTPIPIPSTGIKSTGMKSIAMQSKSKLFQTEGVVEQWSAAVK